MIVNLTKNQLAALGSVVVESANLESTVDMALGLFTGLKGDQLKALVADLNMTKKLDLLKEFGPARLTSKKRKTALTKLLGDLKGMTKERNTAVHGNWSPEGGWTFASLADLNAVGPLQATSHRSKIILKAEKLDDLADRYLRANKVLWKMLMDFWVKPAAKRSLRAHAQRKRRDRAEMRALLKITPKYKKPARHPSRAG